MQITHAGVSAVAFGLALVFDFVGILGLGGVTEMSAAGSYRLHTLPFLALAIARPLALLTRPYPSLPVIDA